MLIKGDTVSGELQEMENARKYLQDYGSKDIRFNTFVLDAKNDEPLEIYPPIAGNDKTERYMDAIAVPGSSGEVVFEVAKSALLEHRNVC